MSYLDQLKKSFKVPAGEPKETKELPKPNCLGFLGSPLGVFEKIEAGEPANDPTRTAWRWLIHFSDRNPLEVAFSPEATHGEVLRLYPDALAAEPIEDDRQTAGALAAGDDPDTVMAEEIEAPTVQRCIDCRHARRPGGFVRYCGGDRPDLPRAYGEGHPLRKLPADDGRSCASWAAI